MVALFFIALLAGCSTNYTTKSFAYQDDVPEVKLDIAKVQVDLVDANILAEVKAVSLTTQDGITLRLY